MKRLAFLDWTRGLAVVIMIECHAFNCYTRLDLRAGGPYVLSQFIGGMAAVLFLFLAGVTFAFQMDRLDRSGSPAGERLRTLARRAGYILLLAYLFRISNTLFSMPSPPWKVLLKVDILNCMGLAMAVLALLGLCRAGERARFATLAGLAIACAAPLVTAADWSGVPVLVHDYLVPGRGNFAFFPCAAYVAFGIAAGAMLRRLHPDNVEHAMQWAALSGVALAFGGHYFSNLPYSLYTATNFWLDSPGLVIIRLGVILLILAGAYLWTESVAAGRWSWISALGKTSLLVYWVHVMLVYGWVFQAWKRQLSIFQTALYTVGMTLLMVALAEARLRFKARNTSQALRRAAGATQAAAG